MGKSTNQSQLQCFNTQKVLAFHFLKIFFFQHFRDAPPLNTVSGLLDLSLFWLLLVTGSLILFVWTFGNKLLVIFHTQVNLFLLLVLFTDRSLNPIIIIIVALFGIAQARHNPKSSNICKIGLLASWRAYRTWCDRLKYLNFWVGRH